MLNPLPPRNFYYTVYVTKIIALDNIRVLPGVQAAIKGLAENEMTFFGAAPVPLDELVRRTGDAGPLWIGDIDTFTLPLGSARAPFN
jgi:hypothetical protein